MYVRCVLVSMYLLAFSTFANAQQITSVTRGGLVNGSPSILYSAGDTLSCVYSGTADAMD